MLHLKYLIDKRKRNHILGTIRTKITKTLVLCAIIFCLLTYLYGMANLIIQRNRDDERFFKFFNNFLMNCKHMSKCEFILL